MIHASYNENVHTTNYRFIEWRLFIKEIIPKGLELHSISDQGRTPFLDLFAGHVKFYYSKGLDLPFHSLLKTWLEDLEECGIDLDEYGRKESELKQQGLVSWSFYDSWSDSEWLLLDMSYGAFPGDWDISIEKAGKLFVEVPEEESGKIPGGWIEEDAF